MTIAAPDNAHIQILPSERIYGQFVVTVRGVVRFIGDQDAANTVYYSLINAGFSDRSAHDEALWRAVGREA